MEIMKLNFQIPFNPPFPRNENFLGRDSELQAIHNSFSDKEQISRRKYALIGTGGMGKTQLALE